MKNKLLSVSLLILAVTGYGYSAVAMEELEVDSIKSIYEKKLTFEDLKYLSLGGAFLGSGGGGSPYYQLDIIRHLSSQYPLPTIIQASTLANDAWILPMAFMGAPLVSLEKLPSGREFEAILTGFKRYYGKYPDAIATGEIGGANALTPFLFASQYGIPIVDGDVIGRAFPRLEMTSANLAGIKPNPVFLGDSLGQFYALDCSDPLKIERLSREITIASGSCMALGFYGMSAKDAKKGMIHGSITKAITIGKLLSQENGLSLLEQEFGLQYHASGIITDIDYRLIDGFLKGKFAIHNDEGDEYVVIFQNEYLGVLLNGSSIAVTPDIISLLDADTLHPITSESLSYGSRVILVSMKGPDLWYSEKGLQLVGPKVFDLNRDNLWYGEKDLQLAEPKIFDLPRDNVLKHYILGVDIGSTNTDAVLVDENNKIVASHKSLTTKPVFQGFKEAIERVLQGIDGLSIRSVHVGTTHAVNAILEMKELTKVGIVNLAGHDPKTLPTAFQWQDSLKKACYIGEVNIGGGNECDGTSITQFNEGEAISAIHSLISMGAEAIAVVGTFSPLFYEQEYAVGEILKMHFPQLPYTLSHQIGSLGIVERKNATVLNSALMNVLKKGFQEIKGQVLDKGIMGDVFICKNNGTLMNFEQALNFPIFTISSGPTNSFIGAAHLANLKDCVVVDIGGTSTDCGIILNGMPKRSMRGVEISGVSLNFPMPDLNSVALGGGSIINVEEMSIGPKSVAFALKEQAKSFGGDYLTLTDISLSIGNCQIEGAKPVPMTNAFPTVMASAMEKVQAVVTQLKGFKFKDYKSVFVGGGTGLLNSQELNNAVVPDHYSVANAYGAALAQLSVTYDKILSLTDRDKTLAEIVEDLSVQLHRMNVKNTKVIEKEIIPFSYMPGNLARVIISVAGESNGWMK